ncbi:precorrin-6A synthase (deacetylating) [Nocardia cyriacigeorgica]|uniref:precorrin-6A synthase (deacetylating) n=1 Tax=Nocardia cyriacigeorgica TaxID=135487 RepID=UPI002458EDC4|nr:precorrin-6A synthase (deacetylating) [Nocardia cyriacigeorgica]
MRKLYVIGIGAGDPDQVTVQAIKAMREAEVFFLIGKGAEKQELVDVRTTILAEHMDRPYRIVEVADPPRARAPMDGSDYREVVEDWHERRSLLLEREFARVEGVGAILVWGDPSLYDSTLRMVERVIDRGAIGFDYTVIPGVTSVQALAAQHRTVLHRIGEPVQITTGRRLRADGLGAGSTVVMLDGDCAFTSVPGDTRIWWGAYLGMPDQTLIAGRVAEVGERIRERREQLRADKGWIMDTYLLRAPD